MAQIYISPDLDLSDLGDQFETAHVHFIGLDHAGLSYHARIFLNNPKADETTPLDDDSGYAGAFHIFGHGGCFGDVGHCTVTSRRAYDPRPAHPLQPANKRVVATDAIKRELKKGKTVTVTVVAIPVGPADEEPLKFDELEIVAVD